jgi:hypothetical protein
METLEYLFECDDQKLSTIWEWWFSKPEQQEGFRRFILAWVSAGHMRATINDVDVPVWKLRTLLENPGSREARRVLLIGTDAGFKEYQHHCGLPRE